tara:strand:- start:3199 stop:3609 length:411 start_codon:yes stop_codon:yes gene_type:complete
MRACDLYEKFISNKFFKSNKIKIKPRKIKVKPFKVDIRQNEEYICDKEYDSISNHCNIINKVDYPKYSLTSPRPITPKNKYNCCICLGSLENKKTIKLNNCKHEMHVSCIKNWFKQQVECPLCRTKQSKLYKRLNK